MPHRRIEWYSPPKQIRQWGEPEPERNDDHFHMFYDLTFVAGAYAAGLTLKADLSAAGVLTFTGLVLIMRDVWVGNLSRLSRFRFDSFAHSTLDVLNLTLTMLMVLFMESTERIFDPATGTALALVLSFFSIKLLEILRNWDVAHHQSTANGACWLKNSAIATSSAIVSCLAAVIYCLMGMCARVPTRPLTRLPLLVATTTMATYCLPRVVCGAPTCISTSLPLSCNICFSCRRLQTVQPC
jgi:low temperature requirement protein LtrA